MQSNFYKQVILVRKDLKLPPGKLAVQAAHASVEAVLKSNKNDVDKWVSSGMKKSVLKVKDENEIKKYYSLAKKSKLVSVIIRDAGLTVVKPGTITCVAIGPADEGKIDKITGKLKLL
ncbi:MAG: peptidyl-tRNA hydrolase Pth2 [Candidatus Woesearchaeota archaeon]